MGIVYPLKGFSATEGDSKTLQTLKCFVIFSNKRYNLSFCKACGKKIRERKERRGRPRLFCTKACKQFFYRQSEKVKYRIYRYTDLIGLRGRDFENTINAILNDEVPYQTIKVPRGEGRKSL